MTKADRRVHCVTISSFNLGTFDALLANDETDPAIRVSSTPFGQAHQLLLDAGAACWTERPDCVVVWTHPQAISPGFSRLRDFESVDASVIMAEVDAFADLLIAAAERSSNVFVPTWTLPADERGLGLLDLREGIGVRGTLKRMNMRLAERLSGTATVHLLGAESWVRSAGRHACNPKLWYMAKVPFTNAVFSAAVDDVKAALVGISGRARKLVVVDLDDTLWGGIIGDDGWENLKLGGHDAVGEAFVDFQRGLKSLTNRGILLGIVSKNTEDVALEGIRRNPEMVLQPDDFAGWRINWSDKAANIAALTAELGLGLQSVVFIDDNPFERARVREALPEVLVPDWPSDPMAYRRTLAALRCFDAPSLSAEDRERPLMYRAEKERDSLKREMGSLDDWLSTLDLTVGVDDLHDANLARAAQLLNKTNQMNLRTRRMPEAELAEWARGDNRALLTFRVRDRFGDSGLTGLAGIEVVGDRASFTDFVLSCRVMGRQIENAMVAAAAARATDMGASVLVAEYLPTPKNRPCLEFWAGSGLDVDDSNRLFSWNLNDRYQIPEHIDLTGSTVDVAE